MESKGRRALRAAEPVEAPAKVDKAVEVPVDLAETAIEPRSPAETIAEAAEPVETLGHLEASVTAIPEPSASSGTSIEVKSTTSEKVTDFGRGTLAALAESQAALARGLEVLSAEMAGLALSGIDAAARAATKMLGVKTLSDAIEVNAGFTCSSFDALLRGSARLSQLGAKLAAETSQPLFNQLGEGWIGSARRGF